MLDFFIEREGGRERERERERVTLTLTHFIDNDKHVLVLVKECASVRIVQVYE